MWVRRSLASRLGELVTVLQQYVAGTGSLPGSTVQRRAVVFTLMLVGSLFTPFAPVESASAVSPDVNIDTDDTTPPIGTELTAGKEYTFDYVISYNLEDGKSGVIKLYHPDTGGLKETREVTGTGSYEEITITVTETVPSDMAGEKFGVSTILETPNGDYLKGDDGTYPVVEPVSTPSVSTTGSSNVGESSAQLEGSLDGTGGANSIDTWFEYRKQGSNNWQTTSKESYGSAPTDFDIQVSGLSSGTTYEFRAVAENSAGTDRGGTQTFTTTESVTGSVDIIGGESSPARGTTLEGGTEYNFQIKTGYDISGSTGTLKLRFSWTSGVEASESVSEGSGEVTLSSAGTIPDEAQTVEVSVFLYDSDGNRLDLDSIDYSVESNGAPTIDSYSPSDTTLTIKVGDSVDFSVDTSDPNKDSLTTEWYVDDLGNNQGYQKVGSGTSYSRTFEEAGDYSVEVRVSDGETTTKQQWTVEVSPPPQDRTPSITRVAPDASEITVKPEGSQTFEVEASDPDEDINGIDWYVDGTREETDSVSTMASLTRSFDYTFTESGTHTLTATVFDSKGNTASLSWTVQAEEAQSRIEGQVTTSSGEPITGATVSLDTGKETTTDANGDYSFTSVPTGGHTVEVTTDEYGSKEATVEVKQDETATQDIVFQVETDIAVTRIQWEPESPEPGDDVSITVTVENRGEQRVNDIPLRLTIADQQPARRISIDGSDTQTVEFNDVWTPFDTGRFPVEAVADPSNQLGESDETNNRESGTIPVGQSTGVIEGTVTDTEKGAVPGATVTLDGGQTTTTEPDGTFRFEDVAVGQHRLAVTKKGFQEAETRVSLDAEISATPEITLEKGISGAITAIEGVPATYTENEWFEIRVTVRNTGETEQTFTVDIPTPSGVEIDGSNQQDVKVDAGETETVEYRVRFYGTGTARTFTAELTSGSDRQLDIQTATSTSQHENSLTVEVRNQEGEPASGYFVQLRKERRLSSKTGEDGTALFTNLGTGRWFVGVGRDGAGPEQVESLVIDPNEYGQVTFTVEQDGIIVGAVKVGGEPASATIRLGSGESIQSSNSGDTIDDYRIENLQAGRQYNIRVIIDGEKVFRKEVYVEPGENTLNIDIPLYKVKKSGSSDGLKYNGEKGNIRSDAEATVISHERSYEKLSNSVLLSTQWRQKSTEETEQAVKSFAPSYQVEGLTLEAAISLLEQIASTGAGSTAMTLIEGTEAAGHLFLSRHYNNVNRLLARTNGQNELRSKIESLERNTQEIKSGEDVTGDDEYDINDKRKLFTERKNLLLQTYERLDDYSETAYLESEKLLGNDRLNGEAYLTVRGMIAQIRIILIVDYYATASWLDNEPSTEHIAVSTRTELPTHSVQEVSPIDSGGVVDTIDIPGDYALYKIHISQELAGEDETLVVSAATAGSKKIEVLRVWKGRPSRSAISNPNSGVGPTQTLENKKIVRVGGVDGSDGITPGNYFVLVRSEEEMTYVLRSTVIRSSDGIGDPLPEIFGEPVQPSLEEKGTP